MELFSINSKKGALNSQPQVIKLAHGRWFSPSTPASSTTKTGRYEIAEILLKVALNTKDQSSINYP
jgi:histidinol phosphatase-like PHP family hydrolase